MLFAADVLEVPVPAGLNEALWAKAAGSKLLRTARVRADTTVIPANVAYPADSGLLAKATGKLVRTVCRVQAAGGATGTAVTGRRRAAARRVRQIASKLRSRGKLSREESTQVIRRVTGELADLAARTAAEAIAVLRNGRRALPKALTGRMRGRLRRALNDLARTVERTAKIVAQTRSRLAGQLRESAARLVSLHDPDARPIRKERTARPVEFGFKAQAAGNDDGVILDYRCSSSLLRHRALQPEQKAVVIPIRIVDSVRISQRCPGQRAQLDQLMPVLAHAGQPRHLQAQHQPHMPHRDLRDQALKKIQYRPHLIGGCLAGTGLTLEPW